MLRKLLPGIVIGVMALAGCASQSGWTPTVDPYGDVNAANIPADQAACRELALQASRGEDLSSRALAGGAVGAAAGAAVGAATGGSPGKGAAAGAAIGGMGGGISGASDSESQFKRAFINCMKHRGHNVIN
jgi:uncharacterized protein YcfJ